MTTSTAAAADLREDQPGSESFQQSQSNKTTTSVNLMPTPNGMSMEHVFFSLQHLKSRVSHLEQGTIQTQITGTASHHSESMTRTEFETEISRLRQQMNTMQLAHQALHTQSPTHLLPLTDNYKTAKRSMAQ